MATDTAQSPNAVQQLYLFGYSNPQKSAWPWLTETVITQSYGANGEEGIDLGMVVGTPITSLVSGVVVGVDYYGGGGVVSVEADVKGNKAAVYVQHLDLINGPIDAAFGVKGPIKVGAQVKQLDLLGWSGGQLSGGHHPSGSKYSTGPHIEVGYNAPYGSFWNPHHLTPSENPIPWLQAIASEGPGGSPVGKNIGDAIKWATSIGDSFLPLAEALDDAEQFPGFDPNPNDPLNVISTPLAAIWENLPVLWFRSLIVMIGLLVLLLGIWQVVRPALHAIEGEVSRATGAVTGANTSYAQDQAAYRKMPSYGGDLTGLVPGTEEYEAAKEFPARASEEIARRMRTKQQGPQRLSPDMLRGTPAEALG